MHIYLLYKGRPFHFIYVTCQIYKPAEAKQESASIQDTKDREGKKERKQETWRALFMKAYVVIKPRPSANDASPVSSHIKQRTSKQIEESKLIDQIDLACDTSM
jgi:hypothetical protein